jgi:hypothetical protein
LPGSPEGDPESAGTAAAGAVGARFFEKSGARAGGLAAAAGAHGPRRGPHPFAAAA